MPESNEHSAEFYRGALSVLEGRPCTAEYYRNRLAEAEAREAGEPTAAEASQATAELHHIAFGGMAGKLDAAAEVIAAAEVALETGVCYLRIYRNENKHRDNWEGSEDEGTLLTDEEELACALALIARWKEANGGK